MSIQIRLHNISSTNDFIVSYKSGTTLGSTTSGFTLYDRFDGGITGVTISGVTLNTDTKYWIKLTDTETDRYIIQNIFIHDDCYFNCFIKPTPTPTPTSTPTPTTSVTPTPTPSPTSSITPTPSPTSSITPTPTPSPTSSITPTPTPTLSPTPTPGCFSVGNYFFSSDPFDVCNRLGERTILYIKDGTINQGKEVYRNNQCTLPAIDNYYGDGVTYFEIYNGQVFSEITTCE